jgi:hypothetical protein
MRTIWQVLVYAVPRSWVISWVWTGHHYRHPIFRAVTSLPNVHAEHLADAKRVCVSILLPLCKPHMNPSVAGHRPGPEAGMRDRHFHCIRAALHIAARVHETPSLGGRQGCGARRSFSQCVCVPVRLAGEYCGRVFRGSGCTCPTCAPRVSHESALI